MANGLCRFYTQPREEAAYEEIFKHRLEKRGRKLPNYHDLILNASLIFANEHHSFGTIPSIPLNFKPVGGQHIETSISPLPKVFFFASSVYVAGK